MTEKPYVLGTDDEELQRLGMQHRLWSAFAFETWERAGIRAGSHVLEIGCGPGFTTVDLAGLTLQTGRVLAFDRSPRFLERLRAVAQALSLPQIEAREADVQNLPDLGEAFDVAYVRWVLCFVPDPGAVIAGVARALRPGGRFALHESYNYRYAELSPPSKPFRRAIDAVVESIDSTGGDMAIGLRLPALLEQNGLRVESIRPHLRTARPHEPFWQWPTFFLGQYLPRLVQTGFLKEEELAAWRADWEAHTADPSAYYASPPMVEIIARKPEPVRVVSGFPGWQPAPLGPGASR
jgi:SAM-dependent methyltransferase